MQYFLWKLGTRKISLALCCGLVWLFSPSSGTEISALVCSVEGGEGEGEEYSASLIWEVFIAFVSGLRRLAFTPRWDLTEICWAFVPRQDTSCCSSSSASVVVMEERRLTQRKGAFVIQKGWEWRE